MYKAGNEWSSHPGFGGGVDLEALTLMLFSNVMDGFVS